MSDEPNKEREIEVVVKDIDMKFWSMVSFMVKWAFASIPALFIIAIFVAIIVIIFTVLGLTFQR